MYFVRDTVPSQNRNPGWKWLLSAVLLGIVALLDVTQPDIPLIRLAYVPAVIAAAWFSGCPLTLVLLTATMAAKISVAGTSSQLDADIPPVPLLDAIVWFAECSAIALLTTLLRRSRERGLLLAERDFLTGLPNRAALHRRLEVEINRCRRNGHPLTLAVLDCDRFKEVNDTLGHAAGDALLQDVARALQTNVRNYDLAARIGGDEFAVLFPETSPAAARAVVERIRHGLISAMANGPWPTTVSFGVATDVRASGTAEELIAAADEAMYAAKRTMCGSVNFVEA